LRYGKSEKRREKKEETKRIRRKREDSGR